MSEFMQRPTRPTQPAQAAGQASNAVNTTSKKAKVGVSGLGVGVGALVLAGAILLIAMLVLLMGTNKTSLATKDNELIRAGGYQSVFLDDVNGQVYFGKLEAINNQTYKLSDVYYPQVNSTTDPATGQQQATGISLAKRGLNELQKPEDVMYIQRDQVLYWENIEDSGQVVCAIADYKNENGEEFTKSDDCADPSASSVDPSASNNLNATQPTGTPQQNDTPNTGAPTTTP